VRRTTILSLILALVVAACGVPHDVVDSGRAATPTTTQPPEQPGSSTTTTTGADGATPAPFTPAPFAWDDCARRLQCSHLQVPLDYNDPSKGSISLNVERRPADSGSPIGSLLVNPGGPGVAGTLLVEQAAAAFSPTLLEQFDIVAWDPRGTGDSNPIDCVDDLDPYFSLDPSPDTAAERQALVDAAHSWDTACQQKDGKFLPYVSTQDTAKDMHSIRLALGGDKVSYFGFSYGSKLGAVYATMFPGDLRAMVIDGASDPSGYTVDTRQATVGIERAFDKALDACSANRRCPFGNGDAGGAFDKLWAKLDSEPVPVSADGRPPVGQGVALYGIVSTLYQEGSWPALYQALAALQDGNGDPMLDLYDQYLERSGDGSWSNAWEGLYAINCLDDPGPTDPAQIDQQAKDLGVLAPRLGLASNTDYKCAFWLAKQKPPITITGKDAGPIVVVGTTGDPVTPIESTRNMAASLEKGVLVTVDANQHTGYMVNDCVVRAVDGYLVNLKVPAANTTC
jgi:pimeloyl-ACP methyl ester carboxylesterase